jgi:hypothetical protein
MIEEGCRVMNDSETAGAKQAPKDDDDDDQPAQREITSAAELRTMTFAPIKWIVPEVLAEGVTILAGNPKLGKSWFALDIAVAVARGGFTLGAKKCQPGAVLYLALWFRLHLSGLLGADAVAAVIAEAATRAGLPRSEAERTAWSGIRATGGLAHA